MNKDETVDKDEREAVNPEAQTEDNNAENTDNTDTSEDIQEEEKDPIEVLQYEVADWKNKYLRLHAEFDNFRKRNSKERIELIRNAGSDVISHMITVLDDFDRAFSANENNTDAEALKEGFSLIQQKMFRTLESKGLKPMDAIGKDFNTDHHEAITQIPAPKKKQKGQVLDVVEKGYFLNDSVLRFAKVVVGS